MSKEILLSFAKGGRLLKRSYLVMYDVGIDGSVHIHSCDNCFGDSIWVRLCTYDGSKTELNVPDETIERAIEAFMSKNDTTK